MRKPALLRVQCVHKEYPGPDESVPALVDINLQIDDGELVALQGPSGSGKSTLLMVVGTLLAPNAGQVEIQDQNPYALRAAQRAAFRARHCGFVFQQFHLVPYLSVMDNIRAATLATPLEHAKDRIVDLLEQFRLTHRLNHVPSELSTGEQQRVALARALLHRPSLLLADEPTGNLDAENADIVMRCMRDYASDHAAVLVATHDQRANRFADRTLNIEAGRLRPA